MKPILKKRLGGDSSRGSGNAASLRTRQEIVVLQRGSGVLQRGSASEGLTKSRRSPNSATEALQPDSKPSRKRLGGDSSRGSGNAASFRTRREIVNLHGDAWHPRGNESGTGKIKGTFTPESAKRAPISGNSVPSPRPSARPPKNEREIYWTIHRSRIEAPASWGITPRPTPPHYLCDLHYTTAKQLMKASRANGWKASDFNNSEIRSLARVEITANGFNVLFFSTYTAAVADDEARAAMTSSNTRR